MSSLKDFLKQQENAELFAGDLSFGTHESPEGGLDTLGYGHKLSEEEISSGKVYGYAVEVLDESAYDAILYMDMLKAKRTLGPRLKARMGVNLSDLSQRQQHMLIDYQFNLGDAVGTFPSFVGAVIDGDEGKQVEEMTRYYFDPADTARANPLPLARNAAFYKTFMSNEAKAAYGE